MISKEEAEKIKQQILSQIENLPAEQAEQSKALKEQIKNATPEQLEAFIAQSQKVQGKSGGGCLFCQLADGKIETVKIYEDSDILAVLDIFPATKGHLLIIPRQHFQFMHEIPDALLQKIFIFIKTIEPILLEVTGASSLSIYIAQGELAGQRVPHFCINLIPRYEGDKVSFDWAREKQEIKDLEKIGSSLRKKAEKIIRGKFQAETAKEIKKQKIQEESKAEKIMKHVKKRMP